MTRHLSAEAAFVIGLGAVMAYETWDFIGKNTVAPPQDPITRTVSATCEKVLRVVPENIQQTLNLFHEAQLRIQALEKYPKLKEKVTIKNEGIIVQTSAGDLKFRFSQTEGIQTFENADKPYSKEQLEALVELFGNELAPYLEILGLKNTHTDGGKTYNYNFYWSSSIHDNDRNSAWALFLNCYRVNVDLIDLGSSYSAFAS